MKNILGANNNISFMITLSETIFFSLLLKIIFIKINKHKNSRIKIIRCQIRKEIILFEKKNNMIKEPTILKVMNTIEIIEREICFWSPIRILLIKEILNLTNIINETNMDKYIK